MAEPDRQPKKTIRQLREERGWSQLDLATRLGVGHGAVSAWELGERLPAPINRWRLADLFGVGVAEIAFWSVKEQS